jgi:predicted nucleic acid-binding protein
MVTVDANVWIAVFDPTDVFHGPSTAFFREVTKRRIPIHGPAFVGVEVACALARRLRDTAVGTHAAAEIGVQPLIRLAPLDDVLLRLALRLGLQQRLRGADALYSATARFAGAALISWDNELIQRAGALTPTDWLTANP